MNSQNNVSTLKGYLGSAYPTLIEFINQANNNFYNQLPLGWFHLNATNIYEPSTPSLVYDPLNDFIQFTKVQILHEIYEMPESQQFLILNKIDHIRQIFLLNEPGFDSLFVTKTFKRFPIIPTIINEVFYELQQTKQTDIKQ